MRPHHLCPLLAVVLAFPACDPPPRTAETAAPEQVPKSAAATPPGNDQLTPPVTDSSAAPPTPPGIPNVPRKPIDLSKLYNDILVENEVVAVPSDGIASQDRLADDSYALRITLEARIPTASRTLDEIKTNSPDLRATLDGFAALLETAEVSPAFANLYDRKVEFTKNRLSRVDTVLSRHNFYDCDTILELSNAETGRRALFLQGDMDVNTDGSDGDRNFTVDGSSQFFQPQTSYRWKRKTDRPNPFLETTKRLLAEAEEEYKIVGLPVARNRQLEATIAHEKATLYEIGFYSFLISGADPFIVLPGFMIRDASGPFAPKIGDYAAVVYDGVVYPAILGDVGPSFKMGEASLRLTKELNPASSAYSRPVSSLDVSYLVFPGTAESEADAPDLDLWNDQVAKLLAELGVTPAKLHRWENVIKPWPTPTPSPTPTPASSPSPASPPAALVSPSPSPTVSPSPASTPLASPTPTDSSP
ncbi:MAG: glycoside hydrolase family 75 protein [Chthoniobacterales bacterium]